jgi:hypothetical protein
MARVLPFCILYVSYGRTRACISTCLTCKKHFASSRMYAQANAED